MAGISSNALKGSNYPENRKKYNGNELQSKEFGDGSGLEWFDFNARTYDQQIGRFIQIDPLIESGEQETISPYHFAKNNPVKYNDPDGKCPNCIVGAIVGAVVDYGTQVAGNLIQGKSYSDALTQVDYKSILISAGTGALSGGLSTLVPKGVVGKALVEVASTAIDAAESAAKQYNDNGSVSLAQTATDVIAGKIADGLTGNIKMFSTNSIKATERQLNRAQRVAARDATSSGRAAAVKDLKAELVEKKAVNFAVGETASGVTGNTLQATAAVATEKPKVVNSPLISSGADTQIKKPNFIKPIN